MQTCDTINSVHTAANACDAVILVKARKKHHDDAFTAHECSAPMVPLMAHPYLLPLSIRPGSAWDSCDSGWSGPQRGVCWWICGQQILAQLQGDCNFKQRSLRLDFSYFDTHLHATSGGHYAYFNQGHIIKVAAEGVECVTYLLPLSILQLLYIFNQLSGKCSFFSSSTLFLSSPL